MKVKKRSPTFEAWQFGSIDQAPSWALDLLWYMNGRVVVVRRSGRQEIKVGEWLVKDLDKKDVEWYTDEDFHKEYEVVK